MKKWNDIFDTKTNVNGKLITVVQQDFSDSTILIKEDGNIISCPMGMNEQGDIYFIYDNEEVYLKWI
ncbi:hypothetical protein NSB25_27215 [Acetatifactor muris]|uniref:Uncharacterized protein n=1 Tax=Acetatifactor muris TaxID=879566 RepID=A0A2K4ZQ81_9FIRM|nr:hypothetical protein [Acetatifactor muris]MCR2050915.1 hypothetical protein [Acetatifactor muris]SOY32502.1 hypothetical protein AMURIS_05267 [Acetatifactor muris]